MREVFKVKGPFVFKDLTEINKKEYELKFAYKEEDFDIIGRGKGPLEACMDALKQAGYAPKLLHYEQKAMDEELHGVEAKAMTVIHFETSDNKTIVARGKSSSTLKDNVRAIFNGLNIISNLKETN